MHMFPSPAYPQSNVPCLFLFSFSVTGLDTPPTAGLLLLLLTHKSCPVLCDPMDCSMPGSSVPYCLLRFCPVFSLSPLCLLQFRSIESVLLANHHILCHSLLLFCLQYFPALGSFPMIWLFTSSGQSIGAPASASVLPVNIQGWFHLGWTGLISLLSKGLSESPSAPQFESVSSLGLSLLYYPALTCIHDYWKNHNFD